MTAQQFLTIPMVLTFVVTLVNVFLLLGLRTKYEEAKQTNQATKEDIGEITKIVEEIKNNLTNETEILKSKLSIENQHKINIKTAEHNALINYVEKFSAWFFYMARVQLYTYNLESYKEIDNIDIEINRRLYEKDLADAKLLLFVNNQDFVKMQGGLDLSVHDFQQTLLLGLNDLKGIFRFGELKLEKATDIQSYELKTKLLSDAYASSKKTSDELSKKYEEVYKKFVVLVKYVNNRLMTL
ncbi:hypothetical protein [Chitinophaga sancti]|uniref:Uncharacterized protein n=1 Tax=Chitinophaga sancti TaxID=1004 RepID=A0A1K1T464_9BACT|nr:hypothetical protein [Chitinophaga sancti]WQD61447.1 hypothetical protein U0033_26580 [Chitinophaga sancti]WQD61761.1 hypothetical protein U0033_28165 [Chitinophaga sancti]WQG92676.1 hypothetical protein SR876_14250 [Chitinophaga sancti]WQG92999.1 hypothetical protein SR876_15875 [Chitinophaga sancti]SFW91379.1 hypothetical protein SAMN05661012_06773 [Chitinophaga sancti]